MPELLVLVPVLYFIGMAVKHTEFILDKYIPLLLGFIGIALSVLYVGAVSGISAIGIFTAITQGVLVAGASVYVNQIVKQSRK